MTWQDDLEEKAKEKAMGMLQKIRSVMYKKKKKTYKDVGKEAVGAIQNRSRRLQEAMEE